MANAKTAMMKLNTIAFANEPLEALLAIFIYLSKILYPDCPLDA
jgi:hypothetical protein